MPDFTYDGLTFNWAEASWGGSRGISVHVKKVANSNHDYKITPDPHNNPSYNKKHAKFYTAAITAAAPLYAKAKNTWANNGTFSWEGVEYTLGPR